jgi:hypothetical protein
MWVTGNWMLFTSVTFFLSVPRYTLAMFPTFILFALLAENRFWRFVLTVGRCFFLRCSPFYLHTAIGRFDESCW